MLKELGRLREISFRQAKEGSGKKRDIDKYDLFYDHIILWDDKSLDIVGSYRVLKTNELEKKFLYTSTLFNYQDSFMPYLNHGLELGRSFIQPKYWNSRALDYLWQGIGAYLRANLDIQYMFGPVSISKTYNNYATSLLIYFYQYYFPANYLHVKHIEPFTISPELKLEFNQMFTLNNYKEDLAILKERLQLFGLAVPTLYKQYGDLCEDSGVQFIDFGIDKSFDYCVDGFILVQIDKLKEQKRARYINLT